MSVFGFFYACSVKLFAVGLIYVNLGMNLHNLLLMKG
jgi:hypothetical protein